MKLISMTDFVLEQSNQLPELPKEQHMTKAYMSCLNYANFLKQPLTLGIFVPTDEDGNFLKEPKEHMFAKVETYLERLEEYEQAKERVLFYGFEKYRVDKRGFLIDHRGFDACEVKSLNNNTIEDLVGRNIALTPYALKQIGI